MGLASMHACVLLEFVERLYDVIDGFNVLTKDYVLKWVVFNVCILLEIVERLDAEINGFNVCILLEFIERLYPGIDDFNVCVLLELSDSLCVGFCYSMCDVCSCQNVRGQRICNLLPKLSLLQRISIRCRIVCFAAML